MGNRHRNKQLQHAVRARMASTGERYQQARNSLLAARQSAELAATKTERTRSEVDLRLVCYFGVPLALAIFPIAGGLSVVALTGARGDGPFPSNPLLGLGSARVVH